MSEQDEMFKRYRERLKREEAAHKKLAREQMRSTTLDSAVIKGLGNKQQEGERYTLLRNGQYAIRADWQETEYTASYGEKSRTFPTMASAVHWLASQGAPSEGWG